MNDVLRGDDTIHWSGALEFQITEFESEDIIDEDFVDEDNDNDNKHYTPKDKLKFLIRLFGVTAEGYSVCVKVNDFKPYFHISIPNDWQDGKVQQLVNTLNATMETDHKSKQTLPEQIINHELVRKHKFRGFTNNAKDKYLKLEFNTEKGLKKCKDLLLDEIKISGVPYKLESYEAKLEPKLRFMHMKQLDASGWAKIEQSKYELFTNDKTMRSQIEVAINWNDITKVSRNDLAPLIIASFDIEASSSHGDFPLAKKDYKKLASEVLDSYWGAINLIAKKNEVEDRSKLFPFIKSKLENQERARITMKYGIRYSDRIVIVLTDDDINDGIDTYLNEKKDRIVKLELEIKNLDKYLFTLISSAFKVPIDGISKVFTKNKITPDDSTIKRVIIDVKKICIHTPSKIKGSNKIRDVVAIINKRAEFCKTLADLEKIIEEVSIQNGVSIATVKSKVLTKDRLVFYLTELFNMHFPKVEGDKCIQIGTVVKKCGQPGILMSHIVTLRGCDPIDNAIVVSCKTERDVLLEWRKFINKLDPDIVLGYNTFGFDEKFMVDRADELDCREIFMDIGRKDDHQCELTEKNLSSSALGDNVLTYISMNGRVQIDLLKVVQRDYKLPSYKLDSVTDHFIRGKMSWLDNTLDKSNTFVVENANQLIKGNYVCLTQEKDGDYFLGGKKLMITNIEIPEKYKNDRKTYKGQVTLDIEIDKKDMNDGLSWGLAKDDVHYTDIFKLQDGTDSDRAIIAKYCIQDCALLIRLIDKLCVITNNIGMANVCSVPFSYIFLRGQGVKLYSLVVKECMGFNYVVPDLIKESEMKERQKRKDAYGKGVNKYAKPIIIDEDEENNDSDDDFEVDADGNFHIGYNDDMDQKSNFIKDDNSGYEGAIVIDPNPDVYFEPVVVNDYGSLYPSCMIAENISHDSIVFEEKYDNLPGYTYLDITYEIKKRIDPKLKSSPKVTVGFKTCRFAQFPNGKKGIIPYISQKLLKARKDTKYLCEIEPDPFKASVLDGMQLAYKLTGNSLYGQCGAITSPIYLKDVAACTTATGRKQLLYARDFAQKNIQGCKCVYGDTDSVFMTFTDEKGGKLEGKDGLQKAIKMGMWLEKNIQMYFKKPHKWEYEKTFLPFILFTKKRYIGHKYEEDVNKYKLNSMGIVLKRRDNALIVKYVYGGVVKTIMNEGNVAKAIKFLRDTLTDLLAGKFDVNMLVISKTLKGYYKDPDSIAHKTLADRMAERDPGNKPQTNDRIPYVYIDVPDREGMLQGDKIEHVDYVRENKLRPNYIFYLTNQIMKPVSQIFELIVEKIDGFKRDKDYFAIQRCQLMEKLNFDEEKVNEALGKMKAKEVYDLLFKDIIDKALYKKSGYTSIDSFFGVSNTNTNGIKFDWNSIDVQVPVTIKKKKKEKEKDQDQIMNDLEDNVNDFKDIKTESTIKARKTMDLSLWMQKSIN